MASRSPRATWLVFLALGFAWGSSYLFIKIGVETLTPFTLVAGRLAIGTAVLALAMRVTRQHLPRSRDAYLHLLVAPNGGTTLAGMWTGAPSAPGAGYGGASQPTRLNAGILGRAAVYAGILLVLVAAAAWSVNQVQVALLR